MASKHSHKSALLNALRWASSAEPTITPRPAENRNSRVWADERRRALHIRQTTEADAAAMHRAALIAEGVEVVNDICAGRY